MPAGVTAEVKTYQLFVNGEWVESKTQKIFPVYDPATEEVIAQVPDAQAAFRRLVEEPSSPHEQPDRAVHVLALALADVSCVERIRVPAAVARMVELVPEDVPLALDRPQLRASHERLVQDARAGARTAEDENRALRRLEARKDSRERTGDTWGAAPDLPDDPAERERAVRPHGRARRRRAPIAFRSTGR